MKVINRVNPVNPVKRWGDLKLSRPGISLTEILVVISIMAVLMGVSIPAAKQLANSFESSTGTRQLINAALSNARAIAVRSQTYAGVRFQQDKDGNTYLIFIEHDKDATGLANGFRAVTGRKPMKLPEDVGVVSGFWVERVDFYPGSVWTELKPTLLTNDDLMENSGYMESIAGQTKNIRLLDASTFSVVFSPQGKLTVHRVWIHNASNNDTIFNVVAKVDAETAIFYQDDYGDVPDYGIGPEMSVQSFLVYSKNLYQQAPQNARVTDYLSTLNPEYISPYTGELVMEYREQQTP